MRTLKLADFFISTALIITLTCVTLVHPTMIFTSYFIVGGWQLFSMIIHFFNNWFVVKGSVRKAYHQFVLWIFVSFFGLALVAYTLFPGIETIILVYLYLLLVFAPVMAIFYTILCFMEWQDLRPKPMARLKY